ncbi:MAG: HlyD family efflux transporter periplasmic adaptor subunit [Myxococcales bacterium]|nr:HlyD family efflux transporter periplasmic adaptor subunit [Myxococcales bacterium]
MNVAKTVARVFLALFTLGLGLAVGGGLIAMSKGPEKVDRPEHAILVETRPIERGTSSLDVSAFGAVIPAKEVVVMPEVAGRVRWQHKDLVPGGRIKAGETLLRIDATSYALQVQAQAASVEQAKQQLALEQSRKRIAESEWQIIGEDANATPEGRAVALREPQLKVAEASVKAAKSAQNLARVNLGRTTLKVPFNAFVRQESVDVGQLVGPQTVLATLVGTDNFWVQVSVPLDKLSRIRIPGVNAEAGHGSKATVIQRMGEQRVERQGEVVRLMGDLDPAGRMARVLVQIPDPLALGGAQAGVGKPNPGGNDSATAPSEPLPLLLGAYVQVQIDGGQLTDVVKLPRTALRPHPDTGVPRVFVFGAAMGCCRARLRAGALEKRRRGHRQPRARGARGHEAPEAEWGGQG